MTEPWIRVHANLAKKKVIWRAVAELGVSKHEAMGLMTEFWGAVSQFVSAGQTRDVPDEQLETFADWRGEKGRFAHFIRKHHTDEDGRVSEWDEYAGALEARREAERVRKALQREGVRKLSAGQAQDSGKLSAGSPAPVDVYDDDDETLRSRSSSSSSARASVAPTQQELTARAQFLEPLTPERRTIWERTLAGYEQGLGLARGQAATPGDVDLALDDYNLLPQEQRTYSPPHVRGFVNRRLRERLAGDTPRSNGARASPRGKPPPVRDAVTQKYSDAMKASTALEE